MTAKFRPHTAEQRNSCSERSKREQLDVAMTDLRKENPKLDPASGSNTTKPPEE
jgi:hypothetical protein